MCINTIRISPITLYSVWIAITRRGGTKKKQSRHTELDLTLECAAINTSWPPLSSYTLNIIIRYTYIRLWWFIILLRTIFLTNTNAPRGRHYSSSRKVLSLSTCAQVLLRTLHLTSGIYPSIPPSPPDRCVATNGVWLPLLRRQKDNDILRRDNNSCLMNNIHHQ